MAFAAQALEADDMPRLFRVIDERSRHAIFSIVSDRQAAAALIEADYPDDLQEQALSALGPAATVESPAALFALRCAGECREDLQSRVGAPVEEAEEGDERAVTTPRGQLRVYRAEEGHWWGIVWRREELDRERDRANQDLRRIEENAETYRRRRSLREDDNDEM